MRRTGVYLLGGPDPDDSSRQLVYVGESDIGEGIIGSHAPRTQRVVPGASSQG